MAPPRVRHRFHFLVSNARPTPPDAFASAIEIRAGLVLRWGPADAVLRGGDDTICIVSQIDPAPGRMMLIGSTRPAACPTTAGTSVAAVAIARDALDALLADDTSRGAVALRQFAQCTVSATTASTVELPLTARARLAVESIERCPFAGVCRTMALTARCHDLLVEFLTAWTDALQSAPTTAPGPADGARLAAEILEREFETPPGLPELAQRIGLSETTLKRAFPRVFGTTVFGYLRRRRLEEARRLIDSGAATVLEAAARVGYSNPSNFAAAFRREFGLNPKTHQLRHRSVLR